MRDNPKVESRMDNPEKLKHWAHKMKTDKTKKTQHNMCWTPLYVNAHK